MRRVCFALLLFGAFSLAVACATGPSIAHFAPAVTGHGIETDLRLERRHVVGELLELRDTAYVVINDEGLLLVPFVAVRSARFTDMGSVGMGAPDRGMAEKLKLVSRFPGGVPPQVLDHLLAENRQSSLSVAR